MRPIIAVQFQRTYIPMFDEPVISTIYPLKHVIFISNFNSVNVYLSFGRETIDVFQ